MAVDILQEKIRQMKNPSMLELALPLSDLPPQFAPDAEGYGAFCRELLEGVNVAAETGGAPEARTELYYRKRPCAELVALAAGILDKMLKRNATEGTPLTQGKV
jgi:hypothetical protein